MLPDKCIVCELQIVNKYGRADIGDVLEYDCIKCGHVRMSHSLWFEIQNGKYKEKLYVLSGIIYETSDRDAKYPFITTDNIAKFFSSASIPSNYEEKSAKLLKYLDEKTDLGEEVKISDQKIEVIFYAKNQKEMSWIRDEMVKEELIQLGSFDNDGRLYSLKMKGRQKASQLKDFFMRRVIRGEALKAFISYSSLEKETANRAKLILTSFGIEAFLAHDDIHVSQEWKERILEELDAMDIFVPILSKNFKESDWAPQEIGIACTKNKLIIPLSLDGTIPFGFIGHYQGKKIEKDYIPLDRLVKPIVDKFPEKMISKVIENLKTAGSFRGAEAVMSLLVPHYLIFKQADVDGFLEASMSNGQVWEASECKKRYIPDFLKIHSAKINKDKFEQAQARLLV